MKTIIIIIGAILLLGCANPTVEPHREYNIYNIINGTAPNDGTQATIEGEKIVLRGLIINQTFTVTADVPQTYTQPTTQTTDASIPLSVP